MKQKFFAKVIGENRPYQEFTKQNLISFCMLQNVWVCNNAHIQNIKEFIKQNRKKEVVHINLIHTL